MGRGPVASDAELVLRAKEGAGEAFGELVRRHEGAMLAIARAYFVSEADAQDAVQEAFLKAFRALHGLDKNHSFAGWLASITAHTCVDTLRARSDRVSLADYATTAQLRPRLGQPQLTPATLASKGEEAQNLWIAIGRLPEAQRIVVLLRYMEHMTLQRIADYLGVPVSTVRGRLYEATRALRKMLKTRLRPEP
jgi:RNA polymerase sigma-70 factor (ECF subfamily)